MWTAREAGCAWCERGWACHVTGREEGRAVVQCDRKDRGPGAAVRSRGRQSLTQGGRAVDFTLEQGVGVTTGAGRGGWEAGRAGRGCSGARTGGAGAQAKAPLHRRAQRGCGHVDKAAFRARGVQAAGNGAGEGSGERPSLQAGDWEDRNASAGVRTWREKQSGFTMGTAPGSERRSQPAQLPCPGRAPWGRRASGGSRNSLGPQRPLAAPADTLPQRTGCPLPPQFELPVA